MTSTVEFSGYALHERIGVGGMAELYLVSHPNHADGARPLILKRPLPHLNDASDTRRRFGVEANVLAHLDHPNIPKYYAHGDVGGQPFLVMDFIAGVDLETLSKHCISHKKTLPDGLVAYVGTKTAEALAHVHAQCSDEGQPLLHRDITPENLMLSIDGDVYLIDYGLTRPSNATAEVTANLEGKLGFLAPEARTTQVLDVRSDLFTLGLSLLRIWRLNEVEITPAIRTHDLQAYLSPVKTDAASTAHLKNCLLKSLREHPNDRYASAHRFAEDLRTNGDIFDTSASATWLASHWSEGVELATIRRTQFSSPPSYKPTGLTGALATQIVGSGVGVNRTVGKEISLLHPPRDEPGELPPLVTQLQGSSINQTTLIEDISREVSGRFTSSVRSVHWDSIRKLTLPVLILSAFAMLGSVVAKNLYKRVLSRQMGTLMLDVSPSTDLTIFVDGQATAGGTTPMYLTELTPGRHKLIVQHEKHKPVEQSFVIHPNGVTNLELELAKKSKPTAELTIQLDVPSCRMFVNQTISIIKSGQSVVVPANQQLDIRLSALDGGKPERRLSLTLAAGEHFNLRFAMRSP